MITSAFLNNYKREFKKITIKIKIQTYNFNRQLSQQQGYSIIEVKKQDSLHSII